MAETAIRLIDTTRFPVDRPRSAEYATFVAAGRAALQRDGILCLDGFLRPEALARLRDEAALLEPKAFPQEHRHTVYFSPPDASRPASHPLRRTDTTRIRSIGRHLIPRDAAINALYELPELRRLVADLVGKTALHLHEDPSNAVVVNVYGPGDRLGWHFDRAWFTVTLLLRAASGGGEFEYVTRLRSETDENLAGVEAALDGARDEVRIAPAMDGLLTIFLGHHSLHRVKPVTGALARYVLILHFEETPGVRIPETLRRTFFGPDAPADGT